MSIDTKQINKDVLELCSDTRLWQAQRQIKNITLETFTEDMKLKYPYLHSNSTTLFDRCISGDLNMEQFKFMINMLEKVNSGNDYQEVSKEVGQKLVDIYVKPLIEDK